MLVHVSRFNVHTHPVRPQVLCPLTQNMHLNLIMEIHNAHLKPRPSVPYEVTANMTTAALNQDVQRLYIKSALITSAFTIKSEPFAGLRFGCGAACAAAEQCLSIP